MKYSPFPYKLSSDDLIEDGILFNAPIFCKNRTKDERCKEFYKSLKNKDGFYKCPHGFGVQVFSIAEKQFIITCLNIEKITDRKILKLIKSNEFLPRLTQEKYYQLKNEYHEIILESLSLKEREAMLDLKDEKNAKEKKLLENTLHDIRKLNNELKNFIEQFSIEIQSITACNSRLSTLSTDIFSVANLLSIRFDSYDFEVNPDLNANALKYSVAVYKKVEKVYKCLNNRLRPKKLKVHLEGKSYNLFYTSNIIEIGLSGWRYAKNEIIVTNIK